MDLNTILGLFNESGGVGVKIDGKPYPIRAGESVIVFAKRVMEEHNAWKAGKAAQAPSARAGASAGTERGRQREEAVDSHGDREDREAHVPQVEVSLETTLQSKVSALRGLRGSWQGKVAETIRDLDNFRHNLSEIERELALAEKFLKEVKDGVSPEVHREDSTDVPKPKRKRGRPRSNGVRKSSSDVRDKGESEGGGNATTESASSSA